MNAAGGCGEERNERLRQSQVDDGPAVEDGKNRMFRLAGENIYLSFVLTVDSLERCAFGSIIPI